jgi:hypothetical protein
MAQDDRCHYCRRRSERVALGLSCYWCGRTREYIKLTPLSVVILITTSAAIGALIARLLPQ